MKIYYKVFYSRNPTLIALTDRAYTPKSATTKPIIHTNTKEPIKVPKMPFTRNYKKKSEKIFLANKISEIV